MGLFIRNEYEEDRYKEREEKRREENEDYYFHFVKTRSCWQQDFLPSTVTFTAIM